MRAPARRPRHVSNIKEPLMSNQHDPNSPSAHQAIWSTRVHVDGIGDSEDGQRIEVDLRADKLSCKLPVRDVSEAQQIATNLFGKTAVLTLSFAPESGKTLEEDLAWHRAELARLREMLALLPKDQRVARVEI